MEVTIGIPAYHAQCYIDILLQSIQIQTIAHKLEIIIASDDPKETNDYKNISQKYNLNINVLDTLQNTGPGLARQRCIDACKTDWIMFADADDVFFAPTTLEFFINEIDNNYVMIQGNFLEEVEYNSYTDSHPQNTPWVFAKLYYIPFLKENNIQFSDMRVMEDCEFNQKIRLIANDKIKYVFSNIYLWKYNENSISHNENYKWNLSQYGLVECCDNTINYYLKSHQIDLNLINFIVFHFLDLYFNYLQISQLAPEYLNNILECIQEYYKKCYQPFEQYITRDNILENYMKLNYAMSYEKIPIIPEITVFQLLNILKNN